MELIKKFKNGKIKLSKPLKSDTYYWNNEDLDDNYYHELMFMSDLSFNQINGYMYIVDDNTQIVYELESQNIQNPLKWLLDNITEDGKYYLYPLTKRESKELLHQLELGY